MPTEEIGCTDGAAEGIDVAELFVALRRARALGRTRVAIH